MLLSMSFPHWFFPSIIESKCRVDRRQLNATVPYSVLNRQFKITLFTPSSPPRVLQDVIFVVFLIYSIANSGDRVIEVWCTLCVKDTRCIISKISGVRIYGDYYGPLNNSGFESFGVVWGYLNIALRVNNNLAPVILTSLIDGIVGVVKLGHQPVVDRIL